MEANEGRGGLGREIFHRGIEPFMESLLGIGQPSDQADDSVASAAKAASARRKSARGVFRNKTGTF